GVKPKRTIRFVLWTGEEQGLLGSKAFAAAHAGELSQTAAVFVMDGGTNPISGLTATHAMRTDLERVFAPVAMLDAAHPFALTFTDGLALPADCCTKPAQPSMATCTGGTASCAAPSGAGSCPSDHTPFLRAGVPAFLFEQRGTADYARAHHTEFDTVDALVPSAIEHSARVMALAAYGVAELPGLLSREKLIAIESGVGGPALAPRVCTPGCESK
ncbi:MAG TPA: M28 family peptidase, partial [Candidatus Krumholzibacteria bacterium]|nr:M28 family peptidase [Candidatus Krumholzibacteria bacterium]